MVNLLLKFKPNYDIKNRSAEHSHLFTTEYDDDNLGGTSARGTEMKEITTKFMTRNDGVSFAPSLDICGLAHHGFRTDAAMVPARTGQTNGGTAAVDGMATTGADAANVRAKPVDAISTAGDGASEARSIRGPWDTCSAILCWGKDTPIPMEGIMAIKIVRLGSSRAKGEGLRLGSCSSAAERGPEGPICIQGFLRCLVSELVP